MAREPQGRATDGRLLPAVVTGVVAALLVAALVLAGVVPALVGARPVTIGATGTGSSLAPGALAVVRPGTPAPGDVVAVAPDADGVRRLDLVEAVDPAGALVSSGNGPQKTVPDTQVEGVLLYGVPWAGALWMGLSTPSGMFFAAALLLLLVAGHQAQVARRRHADGARGV